MGCGDKTTSKKNQRKKKKGIFFWITFLYHHSSALHCTMRCVLGCAQKGLLHITFEEHKKDNMIGTPEIQKKNEVRDNYALSTQEVRNMGSSGAPITVF